MLPIVISETLIQRFKYWDNGIKEGIFFQQEFYTLAAQFDAEKRLDAYAMGSKLSDQGGKVCITAMEAAGYAVWQSLKSSQKPQSKALKKRHNFRPMIVSIAS